jgi:polyphosphate kinase 2 (PPK2 family)
VAVLSQVNLSRTISEEEYVNQLTRYQALLGKLAREVVAQERSIIIVFEGWSAAGKGGCIKRLTEGLDPRAYIVYPTNAPQGEDQYRHYLYRYWRRLPERGRIAVFDHSWYGRVLGDRVECRCTDAEWQRAYREINQFERQQVEHGTILFKFWLHITREEQLRRFQARASSPYKAWKLTPDDWHNHEMWGTYEVAAEEMLLKTSTFSAPWTIVEAMDGNWARIKVLRTVAETLVRELKYEPEDVDGRLRKEIRRRARSDPRLSQELEGDEPAPPESDGRDGADTRRRPKK